jgi:hypothetical protein
MVVTFRGSVVSLIYNKALRYPSVADDLPAVTLMSADIDQMSNAVMYTSEVWAIIAELGIGIGLLWRQMGPVALAPVVLTAITASINTILARLQGKRRGVWLGAMQRRVGLTSNLLGSMKPVKLGGMSEIFAKRLQAERVLEVNKANSFRWLTVWQNAVGKSHQSRKPLASCRTNHRSFNSRFPVWFNRFRSLRRPNEAWLQRAIDGSKGIYIASTDINAVSASFNATSSYFGPVLDIWKHQTTRGIFRSSKV